MVVTHLEDRRALLRGNRRPALTRQQGMILPHERYRTGLRFSDPEASQLAGILRMKERGELRDWADLSEYIVSSDDHMASEMATRVNRVAQLEMVIEPGPSLGSKRKDQAEKAAQFCRDAIQIIRTGDRVGDDGHANPLELDFKGMLKTVLHGGISNGAYPAEIAWTRVDGAWVISHFEFRHLRNFRYDDQFRLRWYADGSFGPYGEQLWPNQWVTHYHVEHPSWPTRAGVMESLVWRWFFRRLLFKWWPAGLEQFGKPFIKGTVPENAGPEVREKLQEALELFSSSQVGVLEEGTDIIFSGGQKEMGDGAIYKLYEQSSDAAISKRILGVSDASGPGENGARSAVDSRIASALDPRTRSDTDQLVESIQRDVLRPLCVLNAHRFGGEIPPIPVIKPVFQDNQQELSQLTVDSNAASDNEIRVSGGLEPYDHPEADIPRAQLRRMQEREAAAQQQVVPDIQPAPDAQPPKEPEQQDTQPEPEPEQKNVQQAALNGAQVTSLLEIVNSAARGEIPRATAVQLISASFPIDETKAEAIIGTVGTDSFKPKAEDGEEPAGGQGAARPLAGKTPAASLSPTSLTSSTSTTPIVAMLSQGLADPMKRSSVRRRKRRKR